MEKNMRDVTADTTQLIPAAPGYELLAGYLERGPLPGDITADIVRSTIVAWRVGEDVVEPVALRDDRSAEMLAVRSPNGLIELLGKKHGCYRYVTLDEFTRMFDGHAAMVAANEKPLPSFFGAELTNGSAGNGRC